MIQMVKAQTVVFPDIVEMLKTPRIIQMQPKNLIGVEFEVMKMLPAQNMIRQAVAEGLITEDTHIIEKTSGTMGLALAIMCNLIQRRLSLVGDSSIDAGQHSRLLGLGSSVNIVTEVAGKSSQAATDEKIEELKQTYPKHFFTDQFSNPNNPLSYAPVAQMLLKNLTKIDLVVVAVGSAGCAVGLFTELLKHLDKLYTVGVDTLGSTLFGLNDRKRLLRGLGGSSVPKILNHSLFSEIHWVEAAEAFTATRLLLRKHSMFMGGTSGATYMVAHWFATNYPEKKVVYIMPDQGFRYINTIYNEGWLRDNGQYLSELPSEPKLVTHPYQVTSGWSRILWNNRSLNDVLGTRNLCEFPR